MTHGYKNRLGEERIQVALFESGKAVLDALMTDWYFGTTQSGGAVALAATITGAQVSVAALARLRGLMSSGAGSEQVVAAIADLRLVAATGGGTETIVAALSELIASVATTSGTEVVTSALGVLRDLADPMVGALELLAGLDISAGVTPPAPKVRHHGLPPALRRPRKTQAEKDYEEALVRYESIKAREQEVRAVPVAFGVWNQVQRQNAKAKGTAVSNTELAWNRSLAKVRAAKRKSKAKR